MSGPYVSSYTRMHACAFLGGQNPHWLRVRLVSSFFYFYSIITHFFFLRNNSGSMYSAYIVVYCFVYWGTRSIRGRPAFLLGLLSIPSVAQKEYILLVGKSPPFFFFALFFIFLSLIVGEALALR